MSFLQGEKRQLAKVNKEETEETEEEEVSQGLTSYLHHLKIWVGEVDLSGAQLKFTIMPNNVNTGGKGASTASSKSTRKNRVCCHRREEGDKK